MKKQEQIFHIIISYIIIIFAYTRYPFRFRKIIHLYEWHAQKEATRLQISDSSED